MTDAALRVPDRCGALLALPPLTELDAMVQLAHASLEQGPLAARRACAWEETVRLATAQTEEMDDALPPPCCPQSPRLVTGHQPDLYHPGVWLKNFIVSSHRGFCGLNLTVDSDLPSSRGVELPVETPRGWEKRAVVLPGIRLGLPWEAQAPLDARGWAAFAREIREVLPPPLLATFNQFMDTVNGTPAVLRARTLADSLARARRAWEATAQRPGYLELDVSTMCGTNAFYDFVARVLGRLEEFWAVHNDCLRDYRLRHRIRTAANPVPDLRRRDRLWETPFWCVHPGGERGGLFVERDDKGWMVESRDRTFGTLRLGDEDGWPAKLKAMVEDARAGVRPRALTLTMFVRLYLADAFLHGVGGARYERVGDEMARRFFGVDAAPYAVASATLCPRGLDVALPEDDPGRLRQQLRDLVYNPQRFARDGEAREAVDRKRALVDQMWMARRGERKSLRAAVREINDDLRRRLGPLEAELRNRLERAEHVQRLRDVVQWRGYPYFLFDPRDVRSLVESEIPVS